MLAAEEISAALSQDTALEQHEAVESAKKTRKWAAWTHEEEEKFFFALRQVGKDFEKITSQVASKNKDQVRHYYYRLIKRMNKFLSSDLSIDARNSKDVDSAMLCWWSLLEKFKCSSSKLHLKPRRLKAIVTALQQQRLKDRKKAKKKAKAVETNCVEEPSRTNPATVSGVKRKTSPQVPAKSQPQAATETVLEPKPIPETDKNLEKNSSAVSEKPETIDMDCQKQSPPLELNLKPAPEVEASALKIKLQLFPIDDRTKTALEQEGHNPHLELTLKGSKSITSVLQHLSQKWGRSSVANGELRLYPFTGLTSCTSWSSKDAICAADVYNILGRPQVFRLRYGWYQPVCEESAKARVEPLIAAVTRTDRSDDHCQVDPQEAACSWLYDRSTDGFGQRLWRDEDLLGAPSIDCLNALYDASKTDSGRYSLTPSVWGGDETCDAFSFRKKEQLRVVPPRETGSCSSLGILHGSTSSLDVLRSSSLDLYWADSLGAVGALDGQSLLLNGNSSLGGGISASLFPDSLDGFPQQPPNVLISPNDLQDG